MATIKGKSTPGYLFVVEGPDGVGKSTIIEKVVPLLRDEGYIVENLTFPGRDPGTLGKHVYELHHNPGCFGITEIDQGALQALHISAHIDAIFRRILPSLKEGKVVILDRFWWSTVAYGVASGVPQDLLDSMVSLENVAWEGRRPDMVFLVDLEHPYRSELQTREWRSVRGNYRRLAREEHKKSPVRLIRNSGQVENTAREMLKAISGVICHTPSLFDASGDRPILRTNKEGGRQGANSEAHKRWLPTIVTPVFDTYWRFAAERQEIFFRRVHGCAEPFTTDPILKVHKFTNAYRASDRVSQFLIRNVIYSGDPDPKETFFRIILFKTFNRIDTWKLLEEKLGPITFRGFKFESYDSVLGESLRQRRSIYSAAYIMPSGGSSFGYPEKHRNHLRLIEKMMKDGVPSRVGGAHSLQEVFLILRSYPMIGDFLAFQYSIDLNYSEMINFSEMSFVVPGPGAKDGIRKCFSSFGGLSEVDLIRLMADRQGEEFSRLGLKFQTLWGRPLQLIDCQNLFCEVDKYARVAHPEFAGITGRNKIKQKFHPSEEPIDLFFPPKWGINEKILSEKIPKGYLESKGKK